jgi:hypothetical protein
MAPLERRLDKSQSYVDKAPIAMSLSSRPTSRAAGKEGREPDRNVLMYLRTGSAGPTQPRGPHAVSRPRGVGSAARIVGRRRLGGLRQRFTRRRRY